MLRRFGLLRTVVVFWRRPPKERTRACCCVRLLLRPGRQLWHFFLSCFATLATVCTRRFSFGASLPSALFLSFFLPVPSSASGIFFCRTSLFFPALAFCSPHYFGSRAQARRAPGKLPKETPPASSSSFCCVFVCASPSNVVPLPSFARRRASLQHSGVVLAGHPVRLWRRSAETLRGQRNFCASFLFACLAFSWSSLSTCGCVRALLCRSTLPNAARCF